MVAKRLVAAKKQMTSRQFVALESLKREYEAAPAFASCLSFRKGVWTMGEHERDAQKENIWQCRDIYFSFDERKAYDDFGWQGCHWQDLRLVRGNFGVAYRSTRNPSVDQEPQHIEDVKW